MQDSVERGGACKSAHVPTAATKAGVTVGAIFALQDGAPTLWGIAHDIELVIFLHYVGSNRKAHGRVSSFGEPRLYSVYLLRTWAAAPPFARPPLGPERQRAVNKGAQQ